MTDGPTQTGLTDPFRVVVAHGYKFEWEQVADDYVAKPGEVVGYGTNGKRARQYRNTASHESYIDFVGGGIQSVHDDRHAARMSIREHIDGCTDPQCASRPDTPPHRELPRKSDLQIVLYHIENAILPELTDMDVVTGFSCEQYPHVADYLNVTFGFTGTPA